MCRSNIFRIIAWVVVAIIADDVARGDPGPNAVALINGHVALECNVSNMASTLWTRTTDGTTDTLQIAAGCNITGNNTAYYITEQVGKNSCILIIGNVTMQLGGVYTCFDGSSTVHRSLVTVIDPVARVVVYNKSEVVEGDQLNISCSMNYTGPSQPAPSLRPLPYFTSPGQNFVNALYYPSSNIVTLMATVKVQKATVPIFQCNTVFNVTGSSTGYNMTAPADNFTVGSTKTEMDVLYVPTIPSFTSRPNVITNNGVPCGISVLTCNSAGNPNPNYRWYDSADLNVILSTSDTLTLGEIYRNYTCETYNTIRNVVNIASTTHAVSNVECASTAECCEYPHNETTSVTVEGCDNGTLCDCSQDNREIRLICNAKTFPNASHVWSGPDGKVTHSQVYDHVTMNGTYWCTAYFNRTRSNYTGDVIFPNGINETTVLRCSVGIPFTTITSVISGTGWIVEIGIICFLGVNILMICIFIGYYAFNGNNSGTSEINGDKKTGRNKTRLNRRFPWLLKMLPCLNDIKGTAETNVLWVMLFALLGTFTGIVTFPVLIGIAIKSEANHETWDLKKRDNVEYENTMDKRTKALHREDLYENIELNSSLHSIDHRLTHSPTSNASIRAKPPPAPKEHSTVNISGCSNDNAITEPATVNQDPTTYAELPIIPGIAGPIISPVQLLVTDMPNDTYAVLNQT